MSKLDRFSKDRLREAARELANALAALVEATPRAICNADELDDAAALLRRLDLAGSRTVSGTPGEERSAPGKRHKCMRCGGEFACRTAGCTAGYDVLPRIVQRAVDGSIEVVEHECANKADEERSAPRAPPICPDCGGRGWPTAHDLCPTCHGDPGPAAPQEGEK